MIAAAFFSLALLAAQPITSGEVIAQIQVHGNFLTPEAEVLRLADVRTGMPFDAATIERVTARLVAARRFVGVEVLKRFASIADPTQILLVIIVDDGRVAVNWETGEVRAARGLVGRRGPRLMFLPILGYEDGYGLSYGARFALPNPAGTRSRLSFPLAWGGEKLAGVELEKNFASGPFTRVMAGSSIARREHPMFKEDDDRTRIWIEGDRRFSRPLRAGVAGGWQRAAFGGGSESFQTIGADVEFDTRLDQFLSPNAVYGHASWERLTFASGAVNQTAVEGRGHLGLVGQNLLVIRALRQGSSRPLPPNFKPLLGGMSNLRGFEAGHAIGDTLVAGSAELRMPLTSPLNIGKAGVSAFVDLGTVYNEGERLRRQKFERGIGGSAWVVATVVRLELSVARGLGAGTRVQFGAGVTF